MSAMNGDLKGKGSGADSRKLMNSKVKWCVSLSDEIAECK